jgi:hypothetical protein
VKSPLVRGALALGRDARSAIVALVFAGGIVAWRVLLHDHVRVRAWLVVLLVVVVAIAFIALDWMRAGERDTRLRTEGELRRGQTDLEAAHTSLAEATTERQPNPAAQDVIAQASSLSSTLRQRVRIYPSTTGLYVLPAEYARYQSVVERATVLLQPLPADLTSVLDNLNPDGGGTSVDAMIAVLDHLEVELRNWGLRDD